METFTVNYWNIGGPIVLYGVCVLPNICNAMYQRVGKTVYTHESK